MEPVVNRQLFELVNFDSATPAGSAAVVHRFTAEGQYILSLIRENRVVETRSLTVLPAEAPISESAATSPGPGVHPPEAITIDLRDSEPGSGLSRVAEPPSRLTIPAGGYAAFTGPPGLVNRAVVRRVDAAGDDVDAAGDKENVEFDTAELGPDDVFALTLVRPGTYAVRNAVGDHTGRIVVTYPVVGDVPYRPADPVDVRVEDSGFNPGDVTIGPGQGTVFRISTRSRVSVDLLEPDDGPRETGRALRPRAGWRAPLRQGGDPDGTRDKG